MSSGDVLDFVRSQLPPAPARVLEIGAGDGRLAAALRTDGYDVLAIDPGTEAAGVQPVALHELDAPPASFDAAVAVVSLHHVEPLAASCRRLAALVRPGGALVVDEIDAARLGEPAMRWWLSHRGLDRDPAEAVADLRNHIHPLDAVLEELALWFELGEVERLAYLYRWELPPGLRQEEERMGFPLIGARVTGARWGAPAPAGPAGRAR